jgi:crotonobetainyl-CoA:carnitine CoA-transferase CaiB-like acyl-CoA transferase
MRSGVAWLAHPQGSAVAAEPLIAFSTTSAVSPSSWRPRAARPLAGLKVLDLTRILAGPVATRFLAGYGADVLRIDPPGWDETGVIPEVALGKRCARLDLEAAPDRAVFEGLLAQADVLVHGYRPAALEQLGYGEAMRRQLNPDLIDVSLNAYGWSGPWRERRGFDSLVQMSSGIAERGMRWKNAGRPFPLPVQALDHATGYLMAAAAVRGLLFRLTENRVAQARLSLARTARLLVDTMPYGNNDGNNVGTAVLAAGNEADLSPLLEQTDWGPARRYLAPVEIAGAAMAWDHPARALGWSAPRWPGM